jgi:hypothetical protein
LLLWRQVVGHAAEGGVVRRVEGAEGEVGVEAEEAVGVEVSEEVEDDS